jgi:hypothetical protein
VEGSNHASHILQRRAFDPPLAHGAGWIPFKINDHEVLARIEHLAQVVVAVNAHPHGGDLAP